MIRRKAGFVRAVSVTTAMVALALAACSRAADPEPAPPGPPGAATGTASVTAPPDPGTATAAAPAGDPAVTSSEVAPDPAGEAAAVAGPDPLRPGQWGLDTVRMDAAWTVATGTGVVIAVVDTGVDASHPDLAGRLVPGIDLVDAATPPEAMVDPNGHGTHVAGIAAAATGNAIGVSGGAPGALVMPVRVLGPDGSGDDQVIADGIDWAAAHGARVINLSLGESGFVARLSKNGPLNAAIRRADAAGVVVVAAAGNDGRRRQAYRVGVPVVVVSAIAQDGSAATFSNTGDVRAVSAPGVGILSTAPIPPTTLWPTGTDGYAPLDGTSMASPLVAAVAALLVQQGLSPEQVRERLGATASNAGGDPALGMGVVDAAAAVGAG